MKWQSYHTASIKEKYIFKFLSLSHTLDFLKSGDIWFSKASEFGDKMECVLVDDLKESPLNRKAIETRKRRTLVSCWHLAERESLAMWDVYSKSEKDRRVCAIRFERKTLDNLIKKSWPSSFPIGDVQNLLYGTVQYKNLLNSKELDSNRLKYNAFRKEEAFRYESEYRYVIKLKDSIPAKGFGYSIGNTNDFQFTILLNPLLKSKQYASLKRSLQNIQNVEDSALAKWLKPEMW